MTSRKASNVVDMPDSAASVAQPAEAKLTFNIRLGDESLTIRTNDKDELLQLRMELKIALSGNTGTVSHSLTAGDTCPNCGGTLQLKEGTKEGKAYRFFGCSGYPNCRFTAKG